MRSRLILWVPLALFAFFAGLAGYMLTQDKNQFVESTMIGRPLPDFALKPAFDALPGAAKAAHARCGAKRAAGIRAAHAACRRAGSGAQWGAR